MNNFIIENGILIKYIGNDRDIVIPDEVTDIGESAFAFCPLIEKVYYCGTESDWNNIKINQYNEHLTAAKRQYHCKEPRIYSENKSGSTYV